MKLLVTHVFVFVQNSFTWISIGSFNMWLTSYSIKSFSSFSFSSFYHFVMKKKDTTIKNDFYQSIICILINLKISKSASTWDVFI